MPIYEYNCGKCGKHLEVLIRNDSDIPKTCPACGSRKISKAFSSFAVTAPSGSTKACEACPSTDNACRSSACSTGKCPYSP